MGNKKWIVYPKVFDIKLGGDGGSCTSVSIISNFCIGWKGDKT
jgi:hypothetical protein